MNLTAVWKSTFESGGRKPSIGTVRHGHFCCRQAVGTDRYHQPHAPSKYINIDHRAQETNKTFFGWPRSTSPLVTTTALNRCSPAATSSTVTHNAAISRPIAPLNWARQMRLYKFSATRTPPTSFLPRGAPARNCAMSTSISALAPAITRQAPAPTVCLRAKSAIANMSITSNRRRPCAT